jgi:hypothetical protein
MLAGIGQQLKVENSKFKIENYHPPQSRVQFHPKIRQMCVTAAEAGAAIRGSSQRQ